MTIRIGFVGAGWWSATVHAPAVAASPDAEVAGIMDPDRDRADTFGRRFGCPVHPDLDALVADGSIDGVVVATPHATHADLSLSAVDRGVGVLVEKPMALRAADAIILRDLAAQRRVPIVVSHPYLFHPYARLVRSLLSEGRIGKVVSATGAFDSAVAHLIRGDDASAPPRDHQGFVPLRSTYANPALSGGGQGQTQLGHLVSLLVAELDQPLTRVSANMYWEQPPMDLAVGANASTPAGTTIVLSSAGTIRDWDDRTAWLRYTGTDGWILHDALHGRVTASAGVLAGIELDTSMRAYPSDAPVLALIDLLRGERLEGHLANAANGVETVAFVEACYRSALELNDLGV
ncbi:Gfo/Idh/MocA family protein [Jiangella endophytica]|uniref:Gfo/Idh/MocA family protein n=1 Tax=Jiangella endophytica TaxID=1623398 RepID=UPI000E3460BE|nr:Gfo/Idh/MocA family oxidoreductase [Jiangella endophytica]